MSFIGRFFKGSAGSADGIIHPKSYGNWLSLFLPNTRIDYAAKVGDGLGSNVLMAPILWVARAYLEANLQVETSNGEEIVYDLNHDLLKLIFNPNQNYSGSALWMASIISWFTDGNVYWLKGRNGAGQLKELWYIPHWLITPVAEGNDFLTYYRYTPGGSGNIHIPVSELVHLRHGIDPRNIRKGLSPMGSLLREIFNDDESSNFVATLLGNGGVPGVIVSPKESKGTSTKDLSMVKNYIKDMFTGDKRGEPLALGSPTDVKEFGFDPQKMNLDVVRGVSEERVCAILGIPSAVVGFGSGMQQTKVGATLAELHRIGWINCIIPNQDIMADELTRNLLWADFAGKENQRLCWDRKKVRALEDDAEKTAARLEKLVTSAIMTRAEARKLLNLETGPQDDVYLVPLNLIETPIADAGKPLAVQQTTDQPTKAKRLEKAKRLTPGQTRILHAMDKVKARQEMKMRINLTAFFKRLGANIAHAYHNVSKSQKSEEDRARVDAMFHQVNFRHYESELRGLFGTFYMSVHQENVHTLRAIGLAMDIPDTTQLDILSHGGSRAGLVDLTEPAKEKAFEIIRDARENGAGVDETAKELADAIPAGPWNSSEIRAEIIARTESRIAQTESALICYRNAEGIDQVMMIDARLGPTDEDCEEVDGQEVSFDHAQGLIADEHPNGTRDIVPIFGATQ